MRRQKSNAVPQALTYRAYMQMMALELEHSRLRVEREGVLRRCTSIDQRLDDITRRKAELLGEHAGRDASVPVELPELPVRRMRHTMRR